MGRKPKNDKQPLTGRQIEHLLWGWCLAVCSGYGHDDIHYPFRDKEHRQQLWGENREYLLSLAGVERIPGVFGAMPLKKGKKPAAFYDYEKEGSLNKKHLGTPDNLAPAASHARP